MSKIIKVDKCYNCPHLSHITGALYCGLSAETVANGNVIDPKCPLTDEKEEFNQYLESTEE